MSQFAEDVIVVCYSEYSLQSDGLSPCEQLRNVAVAKQQGNVPQCAEDGKFRCVSATRLHIFSSHSVVCNSVCVRVHVCIQKCAVHYGWSRVLVCRW